MATPPSTSEPTTALSSRETEKLFALMLRLKQDGLGIVYISHRMAEIYELADRVSVLRDGSYVGTLDRADINPETLVRMMVGRKLDSFYAKQHSAEAARGPVALTVEGLRDQRGRVRGGTWSTPPGDQGLHRRMRHAVRAVPLIAPCLSMAV